MIEEGKKEGIDIGKKEGIDIGKKEGIEKGVIAQRQTYSSFYTFVFLPSLRKNAKSTPPTLPAFTTSTNLPN
ncbi:MAG: hypothetical protein U0175_39050 [Caldilineaceae bacterium]